MIHPQLLMKAVTVPGLAELVRKKLAPLKEDDLPSTSQWHRLRRCALYGSEADVRAFLDHQQTRQKIREAWQVRLEGDKELARWLEEEIMDVVVQAANAMELQRGPLHIRVVLPHRLLMDHFERIKPIILRKVLCNLIDQVLLLLTAGESRTTPQPAGHSRDA